MGWFNKDDEERIPELPKLPELPNLPDLPELNDNSEIEDFDSQSNKLPSFPSNTLGDKFSQDTIKKAVSGDERGAEEDADEFDPSDEDYRNQMMQSPLKNPTTREITSKERKMSREIPEGFEEAVERVRRAEPVFIRIDKFQESLETFQDAKNKLSEIKNMLSNIKKIKDQEETELQIWEEQIQTIKNQIEKIDQEIFSKIE